MKKRSTKQNPSINCYGWLKGTTKTIFVLGCLTAIGGAATGLTYAARTYAAPIVCGATTIEHLIDEVGLPPKQVTASFGPFTGQCFAYVEDAAKILPPTGKGDPSPEAILAALIAQESSGNPHAVSETGAKGCGQIVLRWHPEMKGKVLDPKQNVQYAAAFLKELIEKHGTYWSAIPHYNGCVAANNCTQYRNEIFRLARKYG
jgi:soluble lytic murein transglycosylase-like protein